MSAQETTGQKTAPSWAAPRAEPAWKASVRATVARLIGALGAPAEELNAPWVRRLCMLNGALAFLLYCGEYRDRSRFKTPRGETKVASYAVMNLKYVGWFKACLFTHIASGSTAQLCSSAAIALEDARPALSRRLARVAALAETFFHAPTAFAMSPIVYGDKGITPPVYGLVSFLLQLSGAAALLEAEQEPEEEKGEPGDEGKAAAAVAGGRQQRRRRRRRTELRRMCATISIFLYVRLYAVMRGMGGMLRAQKYSLAVMTAGTAMMPVGWTRLAFPAYFWVLMAYNGATAGETLRLVRELGVDGAAKKQMHLA
jgi:hypothetical protein